MVEERKRIQTIGEIAQNRKLRNPTAIVKEQFTSKRLIINNYATNLHDKSKLSEILNFSFSGRISKWC